MTTKRHTTVSEVRPKKVVVHPELHTLFRIRAAQQDSTLQEVVHVALCHETGRLDLLSDARQASLSPA